MATLYLASRSPRRRELLVQLGVAHETVAADVDETRWPGETPAEYVVRVARDKARAGLAAVSGRAGAVVLGADTSVVLGDRVLGKPLDDADARAMLEALSGGAHEVLTGIAIATHAGVVDRISASRVWFRATSAAERAAYAASGEPGDKAGGYAIQGLAAQFVERLEGSYSGVMGLPLYETAELLRSAGIETLPHRP